MNSVAVPAPIRSSELEDLQTLVGLPKDTTEVAPRVSELAEKLTAVINDMVISTIVAQTAEEFKDRRQRVLPDYCRALRVQSNMLNILIPDRLIFERLIGEALSELVRDLEEHGVQRFGTVLRDQAVFTLWTLRKTLELTWKITAAGPVSDQNVAKDRDIAGRFVMAAVWAQFHLHCLVVAIRSDKAIYPELLPEITDGLRAAVNAYALIREAVDLRVTQEEPVLQPYEWDEEDQELLDSSMKDLTGV